MREPERDKLSDDDLMARLASLCLEDARLKADVVAYLVEVERRRLHLRLACTSMFDFCTRRLNMSVNVANHRIAAARVARRHPCILPAIARGELHLSTLVLLRDHLTAANAEELLAEVRGKSFREVQVLLAARAPKPDIPATITPVAEQISLAASPGQAPASPSDWARVTPLSPTRFAVQLTVSQVTRDKLERAKDLMRHRNPGGDLEIILDRALDALLAKLEKELRGKTDRPRRSRGVRHGEVSNDARREIFARDEDQCVYEDEHGNRCPARGFLEIDHIAARALGGDGNASNLRILCGAHNRLRAEETFGRDHVERAIERRRSKSAAATTTPGEPQAEADHAAPPHDPERSGSPEESCTDGRDRALRGLLYLGFKRGEAVQALDAVLESYGPVLAARDLPDVLRETIARLT